MKEKGKGERKERIQSRKSKEKSKLKILGSRNQGHLEEYLG